MRERKDECSFVSLRDVERMLTTLEWFQSKESAIAEEVFSKVAPYRKKSPEQIFTVNLILALGIAYYTRLDERRGDFEDLVPIS
jgi:hypothetical protein